jgi:hypothetical protein
VLLPVAFNGEIPGAFGSRWVLKLTVLNRSGRPALVAGFDFCPPMLCPPEQPPTPSDVTFQPRLLLQPEQIRNGHFMAVEKSVASDVHFELRVRDLSREMETAGTEIPVVREADFLTRPVSLLDVPLRADLRHALRIYALDPAPGAVVRVRYYEQLEQQQPFAHGPFTDRLLYETVRQFQGHGGFQWRPGYIELLDSEVASSLPPGIRTLRIDLVPETEALRYWAFISVTHNATQHITTITP